MSSLLKSFLVLTWTSLKPFFSAFGLLICAIAALCVVANDLALLKLRIWDSNVLYTVYLLVGFVLGCLLDFGGLFAFLFLLPNIPNLHNQLAAFVGSSNFVLTNPGIDLSAGFVLGYFIFKSFHSSRLTLGSHKNLRLPWQLGLLLTYLSVSTFLAVLRNLRQSASGTSVEGILFNLVHFRPLAWHDDFMPVSDLISYGIAGAVFLCIISALHGKQNRDQVIFRPLICGLLLAATMGCVQAFTGFGLPEAYQDFRRDALGFVAIGFQPDIHAFAGYLMLGAVGLWGYLSTTQSGKARAWIYLAIAMSWLALVLSKSRASLMLAILASLSLFVFYVWLEKRQYFRKLILLMACGLLVLITSIFYLQGHPQVLASNSWLADLLNHYAKAGFSGLSSGTQNFGGRPEIYLAGMRMFSQLPLMGLGQGGFFRQSADIEFSKSFMLSHWGGENAHNYFLQVLVENGLIGTALFFLVIISPLLIRVSKKTLLPAAIGLGTLFLGNIFAHSFLVRENLILATVMLALMYSWVTVGQPSGESIKGMRGKGSWISIPFAGFMALILFVLGSIEVYRSFYRFPYQTGHQCFISKPLTSDGWTSGILDIPLTAKTQGLRVYIASVGRPDLQRRPLKARMDIAYYEHYSHDHPPLATVFHEWKQQGPGVMEIQLKDNSKLANGRGKAVLRLSNCFNPRDYGFSQDSRNLGVLIDRIELF